jgi:Zn finger protein HypA/HybF involved in hydrogenase expression
MSLSIIARCVACKHEADVTDAKDVPMCPKCFSPMVVVKAVRECR